MRISTIIAPLVFAASLSPLACGSARDGGPHEGDVAQASIALTNVPAGVGCFRVRASNADRVVEQRFDVTPGDDSSAYFMNQLPIGAVTFVGDAYDIPCADIGTGAARSWISEPQAANLSIATVATINLVLRPNGRATIGADFQGSSDAGPATHIVTTLAGLGGARGSVDAVGPSARFNYPNGVALDGVGNLYVADTGNETIRKVVLETGEVTTWAGQLGVAGSTDGALGTATLNEPFWVCSDAANLYVIGQDNTIRKIAFSNAQVSTLAGTAGQSGAVDAAGAAARFKMPTSCASDGAGNLYVVDQGNSTIRRVVTATGQVTTIAGTTGQRGNVDAAGPAARFALPFSIAFGSGNLYIGDIDNRTIRKLVVATGAVTTIAGNGDYGGADGAAKTAATLATPYGLAVDPSGNIWISDAATDSIRVLDAAGVNVTTIAGSLGVPGSLDGLPWRARFNGPASLTIDALGNVYVADELNHAIRKL